MEEVDIHFALYLMMYGYLVANVVVQCRLWFSSGSFVVRLRGCLKDWLTRRAADQAAALQEKLVKEAKVIQDKRRIDRARSALPNVNACCFFGAVFILFLGPENFPVTGFCYIFAAVTLFMGRCLAGRLSMNGVRLLYSLFMASLIGSCIPYAIWGIQLLDITSVVMRFLCRFCATLWVQDLQVSFFWNVALSASCCVFFWVGTPAEAGVDGPSPGTGSLSESIARVVVMLMVRDRFNSYRDEALQLAQVQALSTEGSAKTSLLKAMCDVVVLLDADMRIAQPCVQLKHMLRTPRALKGDTLVNYMATEEDRNRFGEFMSSAAASEGQASEDLATILHVNLRDWKGVDKRAELLRARLVNVDGSVGYLVGIRVRDEIAAVQGAAEQKDFDSDDVDTAFGALASDDSLVLSFQADIGTIFYHSLPLAVLFGDFLVGQVVKKVVPDAFSFYAWVQHCAMAAHYGEQAPSCPVDHLQVRMKRSPRPCRLQIQKVSLLKVPPGRLPRATRTESDSLIVTISFSPVRSKELRAFKEARVGVVTLTTNGGSVDEDKDTPVDSGEQGFAAAVGDAGRAAGLDASSDYTSVTGFASGAACSAAAFPTHVLL